MTTTRQDDHCVPVVVGLSPLVVIFNALTWNSYSGPWASHSVSVLYRWRSISDRQINTNLWYSLAYYNILIHAGDPVCFMHVPIVLFEGQCCWCICSADLVMIFYSFPAAHRMFRGLATFPALLTSGVVWSLGNDKLQIWAFSSLAMGGAPWQGLVIITVRQTLCPVSAIVFSSSILTRRAGHLGQYQDLTWR